MQVTPGHNDPFIFYLPCYLWAKKDVDEALAKGWFRMNNLYFTTAFLSFDETIYNAAWLRIHIGEFSFSKSQKSIINKCSSFRTEVSRFKIDHELRDLFALYKGAVKFQMADDLAIQLNFGPHTDLVYCLKIYDEDRLIGCGVFEKTEVSLEGLINMYDPAYQQYSIGKYIMLEKIRLAQQLKIKYFYPGYFAPGYPSFDYKVQLSADAMYYYHPINEDWRLLEDYNSAYDEVTDMIVNLNHIKDKYRDQGHNMVICQYPLYDFHLYSFIDSLEPLSFPFYLVKVGAKFSSRYTTPVVVFNTRQRRYEVLEVRVIADVHQYRGIPTGQSSYLFTIQSRRIVY